MTKKQIRMKYKEMSYLDKIERLEFWANLYLNYLGVKNEDNEALMKDIVEYYENAKRELEVLQG